MNKIPRPNFRPTPMVAEPIGQPSSIHQAVKASMRYVHNQHGEGVLDTIISLLVIVVGLYLAVFVLSLVLRIIVLVVVAAAAIYLLSKLVKGIGDP